MLCQFIKRGKALMISETTDLFLLCSTVGKIMERIFAKRLQLHLQMHGLVAEGQHCFC